MLSCSLRCRATGIRVAPSPRSCTGSPAHRVADARRSAARHRRDPLSDCPRNSTRTTGRSSGRSPGALSEQMSRVLDTLPARQREIVVLRVVVGLFARETADAVGSTPGAVRWPSTERWPSCAPPCPRPGRQEVSSVGSHRGGARAHDEDPGDGAVDLGAVRADDALIDAVARAERGPDMDVNLDVNFDEDLDVNLDEDLDEVVQLVAVLRAWRQDIDSEPLPELVDIEQAATAVAAGVQDGDREQSRSRRRRALVVAAALLVIVVSGLGFAVHGATPGDPLWGVSKVVFSQRAASVQKAAQATTQLDQAKAALADAQPDQAQTKLWQAGAQLPGIRAEDGAADLKARHDQLLAQLPAAVPSLPARPPHPAGAATPNGPAGTAGDASNTITGSSASTGTAAVASPPNGSSATGPTPTTATPTTTTPPTPCGGHRPAARPAPRCTP